MLVKVLLYAYAVGVPASRQMARELEEDVAFRVLAANQRPDFRTISDFRQQHLAALTDLFVQVLKLCHRAGLVKLGHIALDGTKVKANASTYKAIELRADGQGRWAVAGRGRGAAAAGRACGCPG
jgi:transposase